MPPRPLNLQQHSNHGRNFSTDYEIHSGQVLTPRTPHRSVMGSDSNVGASTSNNPSGSNYSSAVLYDMEEMEMGRRGDATEYQSEPLLASSTDATFPHRKSRRSTESSSGLTGKLKGKGRALHSYVQLPSRHTLSRLVEHAPLILGASVALLLFFMIIVSLKRPDALLRAIGVSPNVTENGTQEHVPLSTDGQDISKSHSDSMRHISYENYTHFPLTPLQYLTECYKWHSNMGSMEGGYWYVPPDGGMDVKHPETKLEAGEKKVCDSTITYMLDGRVGLSADLALIAQVASFAVEVSLILITLGPGL